jgi:hypothetical protein
MPGGNRSACFNDAFKNLTDEIDLAQLLMTDARKRRMAGSDGVDAPATASMCQGGVLKSPERRRP